MGLLRDREDDARASSLTETPPANDVAAELVEEVDLHLGDGRRMRGRSKERVPLISVVLIPLLACGGARFSSNAAPSDAGPPSADASADSAGMIPVVAFDAGAPDDAGELDAGVVVVRNCQPFGNDHCGGPECPTTWSAAQTMCNGNNGAYPVSVTTTPCDGYEVFQLVASDLTYDYYYDAKSGQLAAVVESGMLFNWCRADSGTFASPIGCAMKTCP